MQSIWIQGTSRTGKTSRLIELFGQWVHQQLHRKDQDEPFLHPVTPAILVFAGNNEQKKILGDLLSQSVKGSYPVLVKTPLGFFTDEVILFFPLIFEQLNFKAQFPVRLRPETEQDLATRLWRDQIDDIDDTDLQLFGNEYRFVRCTLDLIQLAGASGIPTERISDILEQGQILPTASKSLTRIMGQLLIQWRDWCLARGLLSYGLIYELYWRYLLPDATYQYHLFRRYQAIFADNLDDYPAIAKDLFDLLLDQGIKGVFTYNPDGQIRKGINADPDYLLSLSDRCEIEQLKPQPRLGNQLAELILPCLKNLGFMPRLPKSMQSIQTVSRAELLRQTTDVIIDLIKNQQVNPADIAIIAPGLDDIARYSLMEIFSAHQIPIEPLNEQRPLISSPLIRALLTLLGLIYPHLGRLTDRDAVAEMLVILSQKPLTPEENQNHRLQHDIDPVRGGLLAEYCYHLDADNPHLLPYENYNRWDRLGYQATRAYDHIYYWIETMKSTVQKESTIRPTLVLNKAIQHFFASGKILPFDQLCALRELMETAQHFWEVDRRLRQNDPIFSDETFTITQFIYLLRRGTITANPLPVSILGEVKPAITLATIYQYRSLRSSHPYQFWLDTGSILWTQGGASELFGASLFLRNTLGQPITPQAKDQEDQARLQRILQDLLGRVTQKIYLCHSDLGVNGTEQNGALLMLVHASTIVNVNS
jgi:hypothetical protein